MSHKWYLLIVSVVVCVVGCSTEDTPEISWQSYCSEDGGFRASFPFDFSISDNSTPTPVGDLRILQVSSSEGDRAFAVAVSFIPDTATYPPDSLAKIASRRLELARREKQQGFDLRAETLDTLDCIGGFGRVYSWTFDADGQRAVLNAMDIYAHPRFYQAFVMELADERKAEDVTRFFDSIHIDGVTLDKKGWSNIP